MTARQGARAEAFHRLSAGREPQITAAVHDVARAAEAELAGLRTRLKQVDSLKRKLATQHAATGRPLPGCWPRPTTPSATRW